VSEDMDWFGKYNNQMLNPEPPSLRAVYNEWHGLGECTDIPIPAGGIKAIEEKSFGKWHKGLSKQKGKKFLNRKLTAQKVDYYHTIHPDRTVDQIIHEFFRQI
jgi:hypothetical protein